jgi:hypothetical protein
VPWRLVAGSGVVRVAGEGTRKCQTRVLVALSWLRCQSGLSHLGPQGTLSVVYLAFIAPVLSAFERPVWKSVGTPAATGRGWC